VNWVLRATSFDWLWFIGNRAEFQGSATINDTGDYGFIVTVIDSDYNGPSQQPDYLRIQVWDKANNNKIVFDNQPGAPITAAPVKPTMGGTLTIHD